MLNLFKLTSNLQAHTNETHHIYVYRFGIHHVMNPDPYKGIWGGANCRDCQLQTDRSCACAVDGPCEAGEKYLEQLEDTLKHSCPSKVAGFFIEGLQGVGGVTQFPKVNRQQRFWFLVNV